MEESKKRELGSDKKAAPEEKNDKKPKTPPQSQKKTASLKTAGKKKIAIEIDGEKNLLFTYAKCCNPKPPTPIIGYISRGRGIIIHRKDCKNIRATEGFDERHINVNWSLPFVHNVYSFFLKSKNIQKIFPGISGIIKRYKGKIVEYDMDLNAPAGEEVEGTFTIELPSNKNIDLVVKDIHKFNGDLFIDRK